jgi:hypothetical protein
MLSFFALFAVFFAPFAVTGFLLVQNWQTDAGLDQELELCDVL